MPISAQKSQIRLYGNFLSESYQTLFATIMPYYFHKRNKKNKMCELFKCLSTDEKTEEMWHNINGILFNL